jgi:class 3 adenylate cyclase
MKPDPEKLYLIVILVQELVGAGILAMFYWWLRRQRVKDPSLLWLCLSLLSWAVAAAAKLVFWKYEAIKPIIPFIFSPVSSILLTMTAFRLSRVREVICDLGIQLWPRLIVGSVTALSGVALLLLLWGGGIEEATMNAVSRVGMSIDALASCLAIIALGFGLVYSFYKYGNHLLIALTVIDLTYILWRQFDLVRRVSHGDLSPGGDTLAALNIASYTTLTMIFISLAVAWSLSDASRMKRVGIPSHTKIIAMFLDLRGSTQWERDVVRGNLEYVGNFIDDLREWALTHTSVPPLSSPTLVKFLGDGYLFIWEVPDDSMITNRFNVVVSSACVLHENYPVWVRDTPSIWLGAPRAIGIGIDLGSALRLTFENGSVDYVGSPVNNAAKMQDLARPDGGVVIGANWKLSDVLHTKFPVEGQLVIGNEYISVRATGGVKLQARGKIKLMR